jgi:hypothetical protein
MLLDNKFQAYQTPWSSKPSPSGAERSKTPGGYDGLVGRLLFS